MKNLTYISIIVVILMMSFSSPVAAQLAEKNQLDAQLLTNGIIMVGQNSVDSKVGPYFGGTLAYGLGYGVSLYAESGYGWTNFQSNDKLQLVQIPVIGGVSYNFGELLHSSVIQPYVGVGGALFNYMLQSDGSTITVDNAEQATSNFGTEGIAGVHFTIQDYNLGVDLRAEYNHVFSDRGKPGIENQDWNAVGLGAGLSYHIGL
jgi:hypothetical protein